MSKRYELVEIKFTEQGEVAYILDQVGGRVLCYPVEYMGEETKSEVMPRRLRPNRNINAAPYKPEPEIEDNGSTELNPPPQENGPRRPKAKSIVPPHMRDLMAPPPGL